MQDNRRRSDFIPKFLLDSVDEALERIGLETKPTLYNILTHKRTQETANLIKLLDAITDDHKDVLAILGRYIMEGRNRESFDSQYTVFTGWDALLEQVDKINGLFEELEKDLCQQVLTVVQDKERILEHRRYYTDVMRFSLSVTKCNDEGKKAHIKLSFKGKGTSYTLVFFGSFDTGFDYRMRYSGNWHSQMEKYAEWKAPKEVNVADIISDHRDNIDSAIFDLLFKLNNLGTNIFPGSALINHL